MSDIIQEQVPIYLRYAFAGIPAHLKGSANALALHANNVTGRCYVTKERLAFFAGLGRLETIRTNLRELEGLGLLKTQMRKGRSSIYWLHPDPQSLFPCPLKSKLSDLDTDQESPFFSTPRSNDLPPPVNLPTPPSVDNLSTPPPKMSATLPTIEEGPPPKLRSRTIKELTTTADKKNEMLKKEALEVCKQQRPDLHAEAVWDKFTAFFAKLGKAVSMEKWDAWITGERSPRSSEPRGDGMDTEAQSCAAALARYGIDFWTTRENRTIQSWWAWMDANPLEAFLARKPASC